MEKILGLDLGSRTCGVAISDTLGMLAHGVETYHFSENAYKKCAYHIKNIVEENNIHTIVLGLPKHMNGDLGERAQISIDFKERLEKMMDVEVILEDERLTTVEAHKTMNFLNVNKHKKRNIVDTISAVYILETYLNKIKVN